MFRAPTASETPFLVTLGIRTGLFTPDEAQALLHDTLDSFHAGTLGPGHTVLVLSQEAAAALPLGWVYFAPSKEDAASFDLWWIGVDPDQQGKGFGKALLQEVERLAATQGGASLTIETSAGDSCANTRAFYSKQGYAVAGREADAYGPGEDKLVYRKALLT